jgi:probable LLM family oxidoreductase
VLELGLTSFAELTPDPRTGERISAQERMADLVEEAVLAEAVGLDVFGLGEHHRPDFVVSAPAVALAAVAARTERIRLTSAVTVLSSADPVRVFQDFATLDLLSGGRAEVWAGRGSFTESFPLFGQDLADYDELYDEKLQLLLLLREQERVTWSGRFRPPLHGARVVPRPVQDPLPVWVAVGGNPGSVIRAGTLGLPLVLAIIGGMPEQFVGLVDLYREAGRRAGHPPEALRVAVNTHGFLAPDGDEAAETFFPAYAAQMSAIGRERGWSGMTREAFDALRSPRGALLLGDPDTVAEKLVRWHELLGFDRYLLQTGVGTLPHPQVRQAIELFGREVAPRVRAAVGSGAWRAESSSSA